MRVKYQGGPLKGQYQEIHELSFTDRIKVQAVDPQEIKDRFLYHMDPYEPMKIKRGEYARSNKRLKNGTTIYIWMGWIE